ncbi:Heterokaryon incompatibility protein (HET) domain containing protein [Rhypophila sp. PSN 637]
MKFSVLTTALAMAASVAALPSAVPEVTAESAGLQERGTNVWTHLYYCTKTNWQGECQNWKVEKQTCYNIKKFGTQFVKNTGSTGPDAGTFCTFYKSAFFLFISYFSVPLLVRPTLCERKRADRMINSAENCDTSEDRLYANYPGYEHLDGHQWNKKAISFRCCTAQRRRVDDYSHGTCGRDVGNHPNRALKAIPLSRCGCTAAAQRSLQLPVKWFRHINGGATGEFLWTVLAMESSYMYPGPELRHANEIRLIRLLPGSGPIECEFLVVDITTQPPFEALSYTWGDSLDRREIPVRAPPSTSSRTTSRAPSISVTANCLAALHSLRTTEPRQLWIDAICIDQINLGERHHQLSLMGRIFSYAASVLIFLGEADDDSDLAMDYIRDLHSPDTNWALDESTSKGQVYNAVRRLFARPWFRRVWIIQEALMAREATVVCGQENVPMDGDEGGVVQPSEENQEEDDEGPRLLPFDPFDREIVTFETLCRSRGCEATNPRDKIYALLPLLSSPRNPVAIEPNYADPTAKVFVDCMSYLLPYWGLQLLCAVQSPPVTPGLPSWAPDWTLAPQRSILGGVGASQRGSLGRRDRWKDVLPRLSSDRDSFGATSSQRGLWSELRAAWKRTRSKGVPQPRGGISSLGTRVSRKTKLPKSSRSEGYQHEPRIVVRTETLTTTTTTSYELHTRGIFLGNIINLASPCDVGHLEDFCLTEWVDMSKRLVPGFKSASVYDPMAPKLLYDVVFAQEIGDGWYYYVDKAIRDHIYVAKLATEDGAATAAQNSADASSWRFDKTDFKASFGNTALMWERCHSRRLSSRIQDIWVSVRSRQVSVTPCMLALRQTYLLYFEPLEVVLHGSIIISSGNAFSRRECGMISRLRMLDQRISWSWSS